MQHESKFHFFLHKHRHILFCLPINPLKLSLNTVITNLFLLWYQRCKGNNNTSEEELGKQEGEIKIHNLDISVLDFYSL